MKKTLYTFIVGCTLTLASCNVLDTRDLGRYSPDGMWDDEVLASAYLSDLYAGAFGGWPINGNLSDESLGILTLDYVQTTNNNFKYWPYSEIRDINIMIEGLNGGTIPMEERNELLGQAHFIRAWHYFKALRFHGGVPLVLEVQYLSDDLMVKRNTSLECFDAIIDDLDKATELIAAVRNTGNNYGRIDDCIVAAFKSRVLIHKASPQFNPTKPYNNSYIQEAYEATKAAKELLEANGFALVANYDDVFQTEGHSEAVFPVIYTESQRTNGRGEHGVRPLSESKNATGYDQPTWNLVKSYPMADGSKVGESATYTYNEQTYWLNRDPRFYSTIAYNGVVWELSGKTDRRQYTTKDIADPLDAMGLNIQGEWHVRSGFFCRKGLEEDLPQAEVDLNDVDWLEIRFAEVLFNYAEMANEVGQTAEAYNVLTAIRNRAGIEAGDGSYGLKQGMTKDEMRMAILDEKLIEMSFEGQRFYDLRRHRMLHTYLDGMTKEGLLSEYDNADGTTTVTDEAKELAQQYMLMPEDFVYTVVDVVKFYNPNNQNQMSTPESYYFFPIAKSEIDKNSNLEQNDGWGGSFKGELPE